MAEIFGLGCSHGPIILTPPEAWAKTRERIYARIPDYEPPGQLLEELGQDNGLTQDRLDQLKVMESFKVMHDRLHDWNPDVLMVIGDDQAENFLQDNLPPFCLYTGDQVDGYPFQRQAAWVNLWDAAPVIQHLVAVEAQSPDRAGQLDPSHCGQRIPGGRSFLAYLAFLTQCRGDQAYLDTTVRVGGKGAAYRKGFVVGVSEEGQ